MGKSGHNDNNDERDEEEALSFCDLPIKFLGKDDDSVTSDVDEERKSNDEIVGEEFNFIGPSSSSFESEMCVADELFFQGQILPLQQRLSSASCDGPISGHLHCQHHRDKQNCTTTCSSSGEHYYSTSRSTSSSSRSNISSRSNSINSTVSNTITTNYNTKSKSKIINHFHTYPSPKPQIKLSTLRPATTGNGRRQNSSVWEFLRLGLVRTPEIELQNLKLRANKKNSTSVNPSSRSNSNNSSSSSKNNDSRLNKYKRLDGSSSILSGCHCKCSIDVVEKKVTSRSEKVVLLKGKSGGSRIDTEEMKEKLLQHNTNSDRTFEWLKQLSVESTGDRL